ncbi:Cytidine deaminase [Cronobacter turicensis 564]|nr:Cytidine deaminase [Cronobacter turicensis 564]
MQAALNLLSLNGYAWTDIKRVALAELNDDHRSARCHRRDPERAGLYQP